MWICSNQHDKLHSGETLWESAYFQLDQTFQNLIHLFSNAKKSICYRLHNFEYDKTSTFQNDIVFDPNHAKHDIKHERFVHILRCTQLQMFKFLNQPGCLGYTLIAVILTAFSDEMCLNCRTP